MPFSTRNYLLVLSFCCQLASCWNTSQSRRTVLESTIHNTLALIILGVPTTTTTTDAANAAETIGKDSTCNDKTCLGVWDGLLADCPHNHLRMGAGCASSQDDYPGVFAEPWDYSEMESIDWQYQQKRLVRVIEGASWQTKEHVQLVVQQGRYTRFLFTDSKTAEESIGEFYFTPDDTTVQFRFASSSSASTSTSAKSRASLLSIKNMDRSEALRKQLGYLKLPVLRNRKRAFFFGESNLDSFGPGSASLGPPAEMRTGELEGIGRDVDPKLKIDLLQQFPKQY